MKEDIETVAGVTTSQSVIKTTLTLISAKKLDENNEKYECVISHSKLGVLPHLAKRGDLSCAPVISLIDMPENTQLIEEYTPPPEPTAQEILAETARMFNATVTEYIEDTAIDKGYDSAMSFRSYAGEVNPYQAEAKLFVVWCANIWAYCYEQLELIATQEREMTTPELFLEELTTFTINQ